MTHRFYCPEAAAPGEMPLIGEEAHHLTRVLRLNVGDSVVVFDGRGSEFPATIRAAAKRSVQLELGSPLPESRQPPCPLVLAVAMPKGDRQRWLLEKITELGAAEVIPLITERSVAQPKGASEKWKRAVIESCKQCGRNQLLTFREPATWSALLQDASLSAAKRLLAHPHQPRSLNSWLQTQPPPWPQGVLAAVGPEGGWSDAEVAQALEAGWCGVHLGPRILRIDTAAIAMIAALSQAAEQDAR